ncbi:hypothetical protein ACUX4R_25225 [Salmonella enterica]
MIVEVSPNAKALEVKFFEVNSVAEAAILGIDPEWFDDVKAVVKVDKNEPLFGYYPCLIGFATGHPDFADGKVIRTSTVDMVIHTRGEFEERTIVFTRNSRYEVIQ